jgi:hypothetical protein
MHEIEKELIQITGYKARGKFNDRQDYLKSIFNAVQKLEDDQFLNELSIEAVTWANACVEAQNAKKDADLPEFDEVEPSFEDHPDEETETEDESGTDEGNVQDESPQEVAVAEHEGDVETLEEPEIPESPKKPVRVAKPKVEKPKKAVPSPDPEDEGDVALDKWGCMEGSKNSQALTMLENGATTKEIRDAIGGTYYNIMKKMVENGHRLEKQGSLFKLTHSENFNKKPDKVKK